MTLTENLDWLIDQWCERRELRPLQFLFRAYPGALVHTDQFGELLDALIELSGARCAIEVDPDRVRPTDTSVGDASRLRAATGWEPRTPWRETLSRLLAAARDA